MLAHLLNIMNMSDEEINQFTTSLREVMMFIKYSEEPEKLNEILETDERFRDLDRKAATVISTVTGMEIEVEEEEEKKLRRKGYI